VPAGVVNSNTAIATVDLLPTYCSLAGIPLPNAPFAGEDMSDVLQGSQRQRTKPLFWEYGTVSGLAPASPRLAIRSGNYKFMRNPDGTQRKLFLIPQDNSESTNVVSNGAYTAIVTNLEAQLMTWYDQIVLGNVGDTYACGGSTFVGKVIADTYDVSGGNSPGSGFGTNAGVNYQLGGRLTGAAAGSVSGYRFGASGGTSPRVASDFSILGNRLTVAPRNGNGRFEMSPDGVNGFDFGSYIAGRTYDLSVQMTIDVVGANYAQRMSLSISDVGGVSVDNLDFGIQIGSDGAGGLGVYKRIDAASSSTGADVNTRITNGLPIGAPINLKVHIVDYNADSTNYSSTYQVFVNGVSVNSGSFRFDISPTSRFLIFDIAAHEGNVHYDNLDLTVTSGGTITNLCRKPILNLCELTTTNAALPRARLFWTAQPGLTVFPEWSPNMINWISVTNASGGPLSVTTPHGTVQWLDTLCPNGPSQTFFRLRVN
jgi:hypothetical protein